MKPFSRFAPAALLLLAACATAGGKAPSMALDNTDWRIVAIDGAAPVSDRAALTFREGRFGATVGCNAMGSSWKREGNRIMVEGLISTEMYCEPLARQEMALSALLNASPTFSLRENRLELTGGGHSATLERVPLRVAE
jgi:heat shock protein HslJ